MPTTKPLLLRASRWLDVRTGRYVSPAVVHVEGGRIRALNPQRVPDDADEVALDGLTLLPGLIDAHTHLSLDLAGDWLRRESRVHVGHHAIRATRNALHTLLAGFTTVRDVGSMYFSDVALMRAIDDGLVPGPRVIPAGHAIGITGGHCDWGGYAPGVLEFDWRHGVADGRDELVKSIRYQVKHGAKAIKICATAGILSSEHAVAAQQLSRDELNAIVQEAHRHGLKVAAHALGTEGAIAAAEAGVDSIEHADCFDERLATVMRRRGTYLVPTGFAIEIPPPKGSDPQMRTKWLAAQKTGIRALRSAVQSSVKLAFGTDAGVFAHGQNAKEFAVLVKHGLTPAQAIRSATITAAELLGTADRGEIRPGLLADLIGVRGDPLADITVLEKVDSVVKAGVIYKRGGEQICDPMP